MTRGVRFLLAFSVFFGSLQGRADEHQIDVPTVYKILHRKRVIGGSISTGIGATFLITPAFSSSFTSTEKLFFSLAGVTIFMTGIKTLFLESESERLLRILQELKATGTLSAAAERAILNDVADRAKSERYWSSAITIASGAVSIYSGTVINDTFFKSFTVTLGAVSLLMGGLGFLKPTPLEKLKSDKVSWLITPTVVASHQAPSLGIGFHLNF